MLHHRCWSWASNLLATLLGDRTQRGHLSVMGWACRETVRKVRVGAIKIQRRLSEEETCGQGDCGCVGVLEVGTQRRS